MLQVKSIEGTIETILKPKKFNLYNNFVTCDMVPPSEVVPHFPHVSSAVITVHLPNFPGKGAVAGIHLLADPGE